jgi:hypothetical protein
MSVSKGLFFDPSEQFNKLGEDGWEAVSISHKDNLLITLFKKEIN